MRCGCGNALIARGAWLERGWFGMSWDAAAIFRARWHSCENVLACFLALHINMLSRSLPCRLEIMHRVRALRARISLAARPKNVLCALDRKPALIIYALSNYEQTPTVFFVERARASRRLPCVPAEQIMAAVEQEFVTAEMDELSELLDASYPSAAMDVANRVLMEWDVVRWVSEQNACGVAPSTSEVLSKFACLPPSGAARTVTGKPAKTARMWASRWDGVPCEWLRYRMRCSMQFSCSVEGPHRPREDR